MRRENDSTPKHGFSFLWPMGVGCLWAYFVISSVVLLWLGISGVTNDKPELIWAAGILSVILLFLPIAALLRANKKYAIWKKWAEERGWKEPSREKRAWKKDGVR